VGNLVPFLILGLISWNWRGNVSPKTLREIDNGLIGQRQRIFSADKFAIG
jgi:hypothetical protein